MAITNHYWLCVRKILHLSRSQLIIDFAFVYSEFVNDFMRVIQFFRPFLLPPAPSFSRPLKTTYQLLKRKIISTLRESGILRLHKHHQRRDELIKGQYVACIIIYLNQHLGKY